MRSDVTVDPRVSKRHPAIADEDVISAWNNAAVVVERVGSTFPDVVLVAVGSDSKNRMIEMVATVLDDGRIHIFHAMTPPSAKTYRETGLGG